MGHVSDYIQDLLQRGQYHFVTEDAVAALGGDRKSVARALCRLKAKGELATPQRGFYVAVPPEYRTLGCLPAEQFVPQLMESVEEPYHVALLSAAQFHGAAHHKPQRFQVMVRRARSSIECGVVRVDFHVRRNLERAAVVTMNTPRGFMRVSSPETTAFELVGYSSCVGGLDNVATVLADLAESLDGERLLNEASMVPLAWVQRLGYLLELVEATEAASALGPYVEARARRVAPLDASASRAGAERSARWRVAINIDVEADR